MSDDDNETEEILWGNLRVVGDPKVGKTSVVIRVAADRLPEDETQVLEVPIYRYSEGGLSLRLFDSEDDSVCTKRQREMQFRDTKIFILCYSIVDPQSFVNAEFKWYREIKRYNPHAIILIGTKADLRENEEVVRELKTKNQAPITKDQGMSLSERIGASTFHEISAKTDEHGTRWIFSACYHAAVHPPLTQRNATCLLC